MIARIIFGTKAETLEQVSRYVRCSRVLPFFYFSWSDWNTKSEKILSSLFAQPWANSPLIVRSSALYEDELGASLAGKYESISHVISMADVQTAINRLFKSYGDVNPFHQVLIQPMLQDVRASGVACSVDPSSGAPYRVVNWVDGPDTDSVTSGRKHNVRTWYGAKARCIIPCYNFLNALLRLLDEVERLVNDVPFELEFGIDETEQIVLFQMRQLQVQCKIEISHHHSLIFNIAEQVSNCASRNTRILGSGSILGVMPDWNPAEMIGIRPHPLALSLYKSLITDSVWAEQRYAYGYRDLRGIPLMLELHGNALVDVRASFTSFVPVDLPDNIAKSLVSTYIKILLDNPHFHDKIEFEIVLSCLSFTTSIRMEALVEKGFNSAYRNQFLESLKHLTNQIIWREAPWQHDLAIIELLSSSRSSITNEATSNNPLNAASHLLDTARRLGTRPFAGLARCSFIAMELLNSAVDSGVLSQEERTVFLSSLDTVTNQMCRELAVLDRSTFLMRYGHLRPGTYDILSCRYDEDPDYYFNWEQEREATHPPTPFVPSRDLAQRLNSALTTAGLNFDYSTFLTFCTNAIQGREKAKFEFTRNVSDALAYLQVFGKKLGLTREDLAFINIDTLLSAPRMDKSEIQSLLLRLADEGRRHHDEACTISLPSLIQSSEDVWHFECIAEDPNFVTLEQTVGRVALIERGDSPQDAIAFISNADPGYDWIFARGIRGLVTAYGGVNSHMAIRSQELGIPAVVGCGERRFKQLSNAYAVEINAAIRLIRTLP